MIKDNRTFFLAFFIFILPLLGLPLWWRFALIMILAVFLMLYALDFGKIKLGLFSHTITHTKALQDHPDVLAEEKLEKTEKPLKRPIYRSRKKSKPIEDIVATSETEESQTDQKSSSDIYF